MLTVDEGLFAEWPDGGLLFDVPLTAESRTHLLEVLNIGQGWEDLEEPAQATEPVATPQGFVVRVEQVTASWLSVVIELLDQRGLVGHVSGFDYDPEASVSESLLVGPWTAVWLRPCADAEVPGATGRVLEAACRHLDRHTGEGECVVSTLQREFRVEVGELGWWLERWSADQNDVIVWPVAGPMPGPIIVVRPYGGYTLAGLGYGPFDETLEGAAASFDEFRALLMELVSVIDYGVAALHRNRRGAFFGRPFRERRPATEFVGYAGYLRLLDRVVLDAGPIQVLGPQHEFEQTDEVDVEDLDGGRRLVSIGPLSSWLADPLSEDVVIARARRVFGSLLLSGDELIRLRIAAARPDGPASERS